jgi:hypothetical protein
LANYAQVLRANNQAREAGCLTAFGMQRKLAIPRTCEQIASSVQKSVAKMKEKRSAATPLLVLASLQDSVAEVRGYFLPDRSGSTNPAGLSASRTLAPLRFSNPASRATDPALSPSVDLFAPQKGE